MASASNRHTASSDGLTGTVKAVYEAFIDVVEPVFSARSKRRRPIVVEDGDGRLALHERGAERAMPLAERAEDGSIKTAKLREAELRISPDHVVSATIRLPTAASKYVEQVVEHRLDQLTPWRPENALFGFAVVDDKDEQTEIRIVATSRELVAGLTHRMADAGLRPVALGTAPLGTPIDIDLLRGKTHRPGENRRRIIGRTAIAILVLASVSWMASGWFSTRSETRLTTLQADTAIARQALIADTASGRDELADQLLSTKRPEAAVFVLLDQLAATIPDTTYLDRLEVGPAELRLVGSSTDASSLPEIIQSNLLLIDVSFAAAVVRQDNGRDRFEITAKRPETGPAQ
ncbi:PilN domain-containing protein [Mesorhizobium sp. CAU 1741]|uniref:PilN domain-containing protein n=1 Tax=Mesorhizobium sp. CAU 1741 TaxID=3140366 RepID=UPI00325BA054